MADNNEQQQEQEEPLMLARQHARAAEFYLERGSQSAQRWTLAFAILFGLFTLIALGVTIAYGIPYWPTSTYGYGYLLGLLNWVTWPVYLAVGLNRNQELTEAGVILCAIQWVVNLVVTLVQFSGAFANQLNLNNAMNAFSLILCIIQFVFNSVVLVCLLYLTLGARRWLPVLVADKEFFNRRSSLTGLRWTLVFAILMGLWALMALEIALMFKVPFWPKTTYAYGYGLGLLNYFFWLLYLCTALLRLRDLIKVSFALALVQLVVNMLVFTLQIIGVLTNLINLTGSFTSSLLGLLATFGPLLFNVLIFTALLDLWMGFSSV